ncbi:hypothetical protein J7K97_00820 [Candidatus Aerophobetes bacterium]|nr:hypothetical protein [Candidatus Aerophobetes bacterium]
MKKSKPLGKVISREEFISKLEKRGQRFFALGNFLLIGRYFGENYYSNLENEAHILETFLDDHKARGNRLFIFFTELVACIRWIANTARTLKHIQNRYKNYGLERGKDLLVDIKKSLDFCNTSLSNLYKALKDEAAILGIRIPAYCMEEEDFLETEVQEYLVQDIDESYCCTYKEEKVIEVTFTYVDIADKLSELLKRGKPTEDRIEEFASAFHRIQSKYDSYISGSEEERNDQRLKKARGYISVCLHLLEAALYMLHLYERHIEVEGPSEKKEKISRILSPSKVRENIDMILSYANDCALEGELLARELLKDYADMTLTREKVIIPRGSVLHLRPASALVEPVIKSTTPVLLEIDGKKVRANSVLEIIAVMGEVADKIEKSDVEMVLQGDREVVKKMKENFLTKIVETKY